MSSAHEALIIANVFLAGSFVVGGRRDMLDILCALYLALSVVCAVLKW